MNRKKSFSTYITTIILSVSLAFFMPHKIVEWIVICSAFTVIITLILDIIFNNDDSYDMFISIGILYSIILIAIGICGILTNSYENIYLIIGVISIIIGIFCIRIRME